MARLPGEGGRAERGTAAARTRMVERQLRRRGIVDERVLAAMGSVPREAFVEAALRDRAYDDGALPIGHGQTISQPWIVAATCEALELRGGERVLEVGTGAGYSAAVLAALAGEVVSVELVRELAQVARERLRGLGVANVEVRAGDGGAGAPDRAPFDAIAVHAAAPRVPDALAAQLRPGGRMVIPLAERDGEVLTALRRVDGETQARPQLAARAIAPCRFVPLLGESGFAGEPR